MSDQHPTVSQPLTIVERPRPAGVAPIVALMQANMAGATPDPATLRELLAVQREYEAGEARKQYTQALVALKRDLPAIIGHDSVVDFTSSKGRTYYTHTSLAGVMAAVTEHLSNHGFSLNWTPSTQGNNITVVCRLTHSAGHFEEATLSGPADAGSGRNALQAVASSITYLSRYSALSLLGIATADMKEPEPEGTNENTIDVDRNLAAVSKLARFGKTREDAENFLTKSVKDWTVGDLQRLAAWAKPRTQE
jgi:hypothetical protein